MTKHVMLINYIDLSKFNKNVMVNFAQVQTIKNIVKKKKRKEKKVVDFRLVY